MISDNKFLHFPTSTANSVTSFSREEVAIYRGVWTLPQAMRDALHDHRIGRMLLSDFLDHVNTQHEFRDLISVMQFRNSVAFRVKGGTTQKYTFPLEVCYIDCSYDQLANLNDKDPVGEQSILVSIRQNHKAKLHLALVMLPSPEMNLTTYKNFFGVPCK